MGRVGKKQKQQHALIKLGVTKILKRTKTLEANPLQQGARQLLGKGQCGGKYLDKQKVNRAHQLQTYLLSPSHHPF